VRNTVLRATIKLNGKPRNLGSPQGQHYPPQVISTGRCQRIWPTYAVIGWLTKTRTDEVGEGGRNNQKFGNLDPDLPIHYTIFGGCDDD